MLQVGTEMTPVTVSEDITYAGLLEIVSKHVDSETHGQSLRALQHHDFHWQHLHPISYYSLSEPSASNLHQPTIDFALRQVRPQKGLYPESKTDDQQSLPVALRRSMPGAAARNNTPRPMPLYAYRTNAPSYMAYLYAWPPTPLTNPTVAVSPYGPHSYPLFVSSAAHGPLGPPSLPHMITSNALPPHPHRMPYERPCRGSVLTPAGQSVAAPTGYPARSPHSVPELPLETSSTTG
ncbi:hypothetical protein DTO002I6_9654 [Penicillium roqueforti]|nr:hypothetical protein DTO002I6_9654 [Penicillium roqueforti]